MKFVEKVLSGILTLIGVLGVTIAVMIVTLLLVLMKIIG